MGYIRFNPAGACKLPRVEKVEIKPLDDDAIGVFMSVIKGHKYETLYTVALFTGMREGEVLGLTWDCVDFKAGVIMIKNSCKRNAEAVGITTLCQQRMEKVIASLRRRR